MLIPTVNLRKQQSETARSLLFKKFWHGFQICKEKLVNMEMRNDNNKRKRKLVQRQPVLVRSVKPGQTSVQAWERKTSSISNLWNVDTSAA